MCPLVVLEAMVQEAAAEALCSPLLQMELMEKLAMVVMAAAGVVVRALALMMPIMECRVDQEGLVAEAAAEA